MFYGLLILCILFSCDCTSEPHDCGEVISERTVVFRDDLNLPSEVFIIVENQPMFGSVEDDLREYLFQNLEICDQERIENGQFLVELMINPEGEPLIGNIRANNVRKDAYLPLLERLRNMPNWNPGTQGGHPVLVKLTLVISIQNGILLLM